MKLITEILKDTKHIYLNIEKDEESGKKIINGLFYDWHYEENTEKLNEKNDKRKSNNKYNQIYYRCNRDKYIIFDADDEESYIKIQKYLKDNNLYNVNSITSSFNKNHYYKKHFWFEINNDDYNDLKNSQLKFDGGEIFYGSSCIIGEWKNSTLENIPLLKRSEFDELTKILNAKDIIDTNKEHKKNNNNDNKNYDKIINNKNDSKLINNKNLDKQETILIRLLDGLSSERYDNYNYWLITYFIFINENLNLELFDYFSRKSKKYNNNSNQKILKNIKSKDAYKISTLYYWLKQDNYELFKELSQIREDFWCLSLDNYTLGLLYYNISPKKYIYSYELGWFEYNDNNILISRGDKYPISMCNDISKQLKEYGKEQFALLDIEDKKYTEKLTKYNNYFKLVGSTSFVKNTIINIQSYYLIENLNTKLNNKNYIAFQNILYDYNLNKFRFINKDDYITITTGYELKYEIINDEIKIKKINEDVKLKINKIIYSIFEDDEIVNFWLKITSKSLFNNKNEKFYIHSGRGGNGKGLLQSMIKSSLGSEYYKTVSNNFLNGSIKKGGCDPELLSLEYSKYVNVSEPDDSEKKINNANIKAYSGNDELSARALYGPKMINFKPNFTLHIGCNDIPHLSSIDGGIRRRLVIIRYPFEFIDKNLITNKSIQKPIDYNLKDNINTYEFITTFILLLIENAYKYKNEEELIIPKSILKDNEEYINENNILNEWFNYTLVKTDKIDDKINSTELLNNYNNSTFCKSKLSPVVFSKNMEKLNINKLNTRIKYYTNIKYNFNDEINNDLD